MLPLIPPFIHQNAQMGIKSGHIEVYALFADMAGFTATTEKLMEKGLEGAETLSNLLNDYFSPILKIIVDNGGMVTSFAGDALTAIFPVSAHDEVLEAAKSISQVFLRECEFSLSVKIGIGSGKVSWGIVEGKSMSCYFFRGEAIDFATEGEKSCCPGEIVRHPSFEAAMPQSAEASTFPTTHFFERAVVAKFQPESVTLASFSGEFRTVNSVFISFVPSKVSSETEAFISMVLDCTTKYGGHFNLLDFGDKGATILLLFGAPVAHEDLVRRALSCVHEIVTNSTVPIRAGVTQGHVYAGMVGSPLRCTYTCLGDTVNLAARLMMKAQYGQVLLDERTAKSCRHFQLIFNSALKLKGMKELVPSFILGKRHSELFHTFKNKLIGRSRELTHIMDLLSQSEIKIVSLQGPAGIGKSRLIDHAMSCRKELELWLWLNCDKIIGGSLHPFIQWLKNKFNLREEETELKNRELYDKHWREFTLGLTSPTKKREAQRAYALIGNLLGLSIDETIVNELTKEEKFNQTIEAIIFCLILTKAKWPLVIVVDDSHWLDDDSERVIQRLLVRSASTKIILSMRPQSTKIRFQSQGLATADLHLKPLNRKATIDMVKDLCRGTPKKELVTTILNMSQGNPFFTEQLIHYFIENNQLSFEKGKVSLKEKMGLPPTITAVIVSRIDKLGKELSRLVKVASVIGQQFSIHLLSKLLGKQRIDREASILMQEALWEPISELTYIFSHSLISETVYEMQLRKTLRSMHKLVARTMEKLYSDEISKHFAQIAHHYERAEVKSRAFKYLLLAGKQAMEAYRNEEALAFLERAMEKTTSTSQKIEVLGARSAVLLTKGRWKDCRDIHERIIKYAKKRKKAKLHANSLFDLGNIIRLMGDVTKGECLLKKALSLYEEMEDEQGRVKTLSALGAVALLRGNGKESLSLLKKARQIALTHKMDDVVLKIESQRALLYSNDGKLKKACSIYEGLLKKAEDGKKLRVQVGLNMSLGHTNFDLGNFEASEKFNRQALKLAIHLGDRSSLCRVLANLGGVYWSKGDYLHAEACYRGDLRVAKEVGDMRAVGIASGCIGGLRMDCGDYSGAIEWLEKQLAIAKKMNIAEDIAYVTQQLGYIYKLLHDFDKCHGHFDKSLTICRKHNFPYLQSLTLYYKSLALCLTKEWKNARKCNDKALELAQEIGAAGIMFFRMKLMHLRLLAADRVALIEDVRRSLENLLGQFEDEQYIAEIYYELSFLTDYSEYTQKAIQSYDELYEKQPDSEFQAKCKELMSRKRVL